MNKKILNLTQHPATATQIAAGVVEPDAETKDYIRQLITFVEIPSYKDLAGNALKLVDLVLQKGFNEVMIGGAPFFMPHLERQLRLKDIVVRYAFSKRESVEVTNPDGSITKTQVFKHIGFFSVPEDD